VDNRTPYPLTDTLLGVVLFRAQVYRDLAQDSRSTRAALFVVMIVALTTGVAGGLAAGYDALTLLVSLAVTLAIDLLMWLAVSWTLAFACRRAFRASGTTPQMSRIVGFTGLFRVLEAVPWLSLVGDVLWIAATAYAVRAVTQLSKAKAAVAVISVAVAALAARAIAGRLAYLALAALLPALADLAARLVELLQFR
jgi:hypothetical protein